MAVIYCYGIRESGTERQISVELASLTAFSNYVPVRR
jgi:hypothetical protein